MSLLGVCVGAARVTAVVSDDAGRRRSTSYAVLNPTRPAPDAAELAPESLWRASLQAVDQALDQALDQAIDRAGPATAGRAPQALGLTGGADTLVLWDHDTLGSPRPMLTGGDRRAGQVLAGLDAGTLAGSARSAGIEPDATRLGPRLAWLAAHEPHTWALVASGRYAVGPATSYLLARMTRGLWHACDPTTASATMLHDPRRPETWSEELCGAFGVPVHALPELVATCGPIATTDPRVLEGLAVPVTAFVAAPPSSPGAGGPDDERAAVRAAYLAGVGAGLLPPPGS